MILVSLTLSFSFFAARPSNNVQWDGRHVKRWHGWRVRSFHSIVCPSSKRITAVGDTGLDSCLSRGQRRCQFVAARSVVVVSSFLAVVQIERSHLVCHRCSFFSNCSSLRYRMGGGMKGGGMGGGYVSFVGCVLLEVFLLRVPSCFASDCSTGVEF